MYTAYIRTKKDKFYSEGVVVRDEHEKEMFINNLSINKKYECRDLTSDELVANGYEPDHYLSLTDRLPRINPIMDEIIQPNKQGIATSFGKWIIKHIVPILVTIACGLIVAYLSYRFHWLE